MRKISLENRYPNRVMKELGDGSCWRVVEYKLPNEVQGKYVCKELMHSYRGRIGFNEENIRRTARHLRKERDYLKRQYDEKLPYLIVREKIIVIPPKGDIQGSIISVQELIRDPIDIVRAKSKYENHPNWDNFCEEVRSFVRITKELDSKNTSNDNEFNHAMPDISHLEQLYVEEIDGALHLRMVDTNYVLPADNGIATDIKLFERNTFTLASIEHQILGRSLNDLRKDVFYQKSAVLDIVQTELNGQLDNGYGGWNAVNNALMFGGWYTRNEMSEDHAFFESEFQSLYLEISNLVGVEEVKGEYRPKKGVQQVLFHLNDKKVLCEIKWKEPGMVRVLTKSPPKKFWVEVATIKQEYLHRYLTKSMVAG